jgi:hypothetical protein
MQGHVPDRLILRPIRSLHAPLFLTSRLVGIFINQHFSLYAGFQQKAKDIKNNSVLTLFVTYGILLSIKALLNEDTESYMQARIVLSREMKWKQREKNISFFIQNIYLYLASLLSILYHLSDRF